MIFFKSFKKLVRTFLGLFGTYTVNFSVNYYHFLYILIMVSLYICSEPLGKLLVEKQEKMHRLIYRNPQPKKCGLWVEQNMEFLFSRR